MEPWNLLDRASPDEARTLLTTCCGAARWVERMLAQRPFRSQYGLLSAARDEWFALTADDWREAFTHHPKIGDRDAPGATFAATRHLSKREQSGVERASGAVLDALAEANRAYEERFGYIFIVSASGKDATEMLDLLRARLRNKPEVEILVAAGEQAQITERRLRGLQEP